MRVAFAAATGVLLVLALTSVRFWLEVPRQAGVDFYQYWGIAKAQRAAGLQLGNPYRNRGGYQDGLDRLAAQSGDARLAEAVASRPLPDLTATPSAYSLLGAWPGPYSRGLALYRIAQLAAFALAVFLLARALVPAPLAAGFAAAVAAASDPLLLDVAVGNVTTLQLLGLVVVAEVLRRGGPTRALAWWAPPLLLAVGLLKPTLLLPAGLLGLVVLARQPSPAGRASAVAAGILASAVLALAPVLLFGDFAIWTDWWAGIFSSQTRLSYEVVEGNFSGVTLLARLADVSVGASLGLTALALGASLTGALALARWRHAGALRWRDAGRATLADPLGPAVLGILLLLALSPLVWSHYHVLAVAPGLWLCRSGERWTRALGWATLLLAVDLPRRLYLLWGDLPWMLWDASHAWGWVPAWIGLLGVLAARLRGVAAAA